MNVTSIPPPPPLRPPTASRDPLEPATPADDPYQTNLLLMCFITILVDLYLAIALFLFCLQ